MNYLFVFFVSFACILLELFWTKILNLKAWNHVVYTVIPFAILGYGIGANIHLTLNKKFSSAASRNLLAGCLLALGAFIIFGTWAIIRLPISVEYLLNFFASFKAMGMLLLAYTIFMVPFILIGFVIVHVFATCPKEVHRLYFIDLVGASFGAAAFFYFLHHFAVVRSLLILSFTAFALGGYCLLTRWRRAVLLAALLMAAAGLTLYPEPFQYNVDYVKGWEWIPGYFKSQDYDLISTQWHSLGRTDIFRIKDPDVRSGFAADRNVTFQLNVRPLPEFSLITTNFLSGTPVFRYPQLNQKTLPKEIDLYSQTVEAPYVLVKDPKVFIIGVGGGRDIFLAKTHGAVEIVGAEINQEIVRAMSKGGLMYDYSRRVYDLARVQAIDGRHLVKVSPRNYYDLIVLNGVDTFSGLSSGAYAYAESYLYTKEAVVDYLKILKDNGVINFNRWLFRPPRETLRLEAIVLEALKSMGVKNPGEHILILEQAGWSMTLVKKTPFTSKDVTKVVDYARSHDMMLLYPSDRDVRIVNHPFQFFDVYAESFRKNKQRFLAAVYPYDISVVTDDQPFFYKYYKFHPWDILWPSVIHNSGPIIFLTQFLVLLQGVIFILLFIIAPLRWSKNTDIRKIPSRAIGPFITYFACLGLGYMFMEIPLMQKFVLLLGTPILSIAVVLAALLFWTGLGSLLLPRFQRLGKLDDYGVILSAALAVAVFTFGLVGLGSTVLDMAVGLPFVARVLLVILLLAPLGIFLGAFFPSGLKIVSKHGPSATAWGWAINCGFSVLGSMLAIILAQFMGFTAVLLMAVVVYLLAVLSFQRLVSG
jgi:hypothetical protein